MRPTAQPPRRHRRMPQIGIQTVDGVFVVSIDGWLVRECKDELDAHHWAKHAFEAVAAGARSTTSIAYAMERICLRATRFNLHRPPHMLTPGRLPSQPHSPN
jgi:hypothetical protein